MGKVNDATITSLLFQEGSVPTTPASTKWKAYFKTTGLFVVDDAGAETGPLAAATSVTSSLLGVVGYAPGSDGVVHTTTSATSEDVDATNVIVTFTAPASGNVLVKASALTDKSGGASNGFWQVRESTTVLKEVYLFSGNFTARRVDAAFYISGISGGSHTYKLGHRVGTGGEGSAIYGGPTYGQVILEVWSAP